MCLRLRKCVQGHDVCQCLQIGQHSERFIEAQRERLDTSMDRCRSMADLVMINAITSITLLSYYLLAKYPSVGSKVMVGEGTRGGRERRKEGGREQGDGGRGNKGRDGEKEGGRE